MFEFELKIESISAVGAVSGRERDEVEAIAVGGVVVGGGGGGIAELIVVALVTLDNDDNFVDDIDDDDADDDGCANTTAASDGRRTTSDVDEAGDDVDDDNVGNDDGRCGCGCCSLAAETTCGMSAFEPVIPYASMKMRAAARCSHSSVTDKPKVELP